MDVNGVEVRIGQDLPHVKWTYVQLQMGAQELRSFAMILKETATELFKGFDEEKETNIRNMADHRRLCHATLNPCLDHFYYARKRIKLTWGSPMCQVRRRLGRSREVAAKF